MSTNRGGFFQQASVNNRLLWNFLRSAAIIVWMWVLITRGVSTQACTCGSCFPRCRDRHEVVELLHWFTSVRNMPLHAYSRCILLPSGTCETVLHYTDNLAFHVHGSPLLYELCSVIAVPVSVPTDRRYRAVLTKTEILFNGCIWKQLDEA